MNARPLPPTPPGHWLSGNLGEFRVGRLDYITDCVRKHGDIVHLRFFHRRVVLVSHPDAIEEILVTHSKQFIKHFALRLNPLVLGQGLLTSEGDFWLKQRRLVQPAFLRQRLKGYAETMVASTRKRLDTWAPGQERDIASEMMKLTLDIAARTLFSSSAEQDAADVAHALKSLQENFIQRFNRMFLVPTWFPTPTNFRMRRLVRRLDSIIYRFIREHRASGQDQGDLLSILLNARDEDDGSRMTDRQVRDEAMTLFLAGHETTALALSWTWLLLAQHPEVEQRLVAEVRAVCGDREPTFDDVPKLKYLEMVVNESMRLYPPAYTIGREALEDCQIAGFVIPKKTTVLMSTWVVHHDPRWYPEPEKFQPERWSDERKKELPKFAYFPFGGGPRQCIGNSFAMIELVLTLACVAQRYRFTLKPGAEVKAWPTFTLRPVPGIPAILEGR